MTIPIWGHFMDHTSSSQSVHSYNPKASMLERAWNNPSSLLKTHPEMPWDKWLNRLGKVNDILATPCAITPMIWAQALFRTAPRLLYAFGGKPFMLADAFNRFGMHHGHKGKFRIPQMSQLLEGTLPIPEGIMYSGIKLSGDLALKVLWWFFIADVTTEGLLDWTSLAFMYAGCNTGDSFLELEKVEGPLLSFTQATGVIVDAWTVKGSKDYTWSWNGSPLPEDQDVTVSFHVDVGHNPFGLQDATCSFYLYDWFNDVVLTDKPEADRNEVGDARVGTVWRPLLNHQPQRNILVLCDKGDGVVYCTGGVYQEYGHKSPHHGVLADP